MRGFASLVIVLTVGQAAALNEDYYFERDGLVGPPLIVDGDG